MSAVTEDGFPAESLQRSSSSSSKDPDAGLQASTHYERKLPPWRNKLRQTLIPIVRWETPYLARMQKACRSPLLDSYFALTANLGTHTFFAVLIPMCFWCGYPNFGVALVHMLGLGVYLTGAMKDLVCLPRPLSPPLQRISMSGSAALEYGFPSTHTTNAVSIALYLLNELYISRDEWPTASYRLLCLGCFFYATSIALGRLYCGMHGYFDVAVGLVLGAFITWLRVTYGATYDLWIISGGWIRPAFVIAILPLFIRFHPEPADNCPCFDDSVALLGVVMGVAIGTWHRAQLIGDQLHSDPSLLRLYDYSNQDLSKCLARLVGGIIVIFVWRAMMKPLMLRYLPPIFRFVDHWGLMIPRRYFLQASDYKRVPPLRRDDNIMPSASDIPSMLSAFRNPRQRRVSIGPQSEADAREFLANREKQRRDRSASSPRRRQARKVPTTNSDASSPSLVEHTTSYPLTRQTLDYDVDHAASISGKAISKASLQTDAPNRNLLTPPASDAGGSSDSGKEDERHDKAMFLALIKPRTHYDVEVITKLVVYVGIAWLAVEGNPFLFEKLGID